MRPMGGFCPGRPNKNIFRTRRSHSDTGIARYDASMIGTVAVILALLCAGIFLAHAVDAYRAR
jgi:hypothetical protein